MQSREFFEVHVKVGDDWKLSSSFETESEARRYVLDMRKKVSYRIVRDRYDSEAQKFKGRRILTEKLLEEPNSLAANLAARGKAQEKLLENRQSRLNGAKSDASKDDEKDERSIFERFVETLKDEAAQKDN